MRQSIAAIIAFGGCSAVPPPPLVPFHSTTAAEERGTTSAMLILGAAGQPLGMGFGAAVRIEHQATDRTALGFDIVAGRGLDTVKPEPKLFVGVRGFGRTNPTTRDWLAVTYGAGLSYLDSGNLSVSLQLGGAVAATNETFVPYATLGVAPVLVLRRGRGYSTDAASIGCIACSAKDELSRPEAEAPRSEVFLHGGAGFVGYLSDERRLSLDLGLAYALRDGSPVMSMSLAGRQ